LPGTQKTPLLLAFVLIRPWLIEGNYAANEGKRMERVVRVEKT
jgi:hypothetical protein